MCSLQAHEWATVDRPTPGTSGAGPLVVKAVNVLKPITEYITAIEEAKHDDFNTLINHAVPMVFGQPSSNSENLGHKVCKILGLVEWS